MKTSLLLLVGVMFLGCDGADPIQCHTTATETFIGGPGRPVTKTFAHDWSCPDEGDLCLETGRGSEPELGCESFAGWDGACDGVQELGCVCNVCARLGFASCVAFRDAADVPYVRCFDE